MDIVTAVKRSPFVLPLACAAVVAMVVVSEVAYWQSIHTLDDLGEISAARSSVQRLQQGILAAEAGQRGYLLTARREHLAPYDQALKEIDESLEQLDRYYAIDTDAGSVVVKLHALTHIKLSELASAIRLYDEGKSAASTDIVLSELNKRQMEAIRALGADLLEAQALKAEAGRKDLYSTLLQRRIGMALLGAISLLALYLYLRQSRALKQRELQLKDVVQAERDRLEIEVAERTAQLTELTRHLLSAREDERHRLARNLHDELGALLTSAKLDAARIRSRLAGTAPEALERLAHLVETLNASIALGRSIIEDLRPSTLANLGLVATLQILVREFGERSGVEVECALAPVQLDCGRRADRLSAGAGSRHQHQQVRAGQTCVADDGHARRPRPGDGARRRRRLRHRGAAAFGLRPGGHALPRRSRGRHAVGHLGARPGHAAGADAA